MTNENVVDVHAKHVDTADITSVIQLDDDKLKIIFKSKAACKKFTSQIYACIFEQAPASPASAPVATVKQSFDGKYWVHWTSLPVVGMKLYAAPVAHDQAQSVPEGWKLVPAEPTPEMWKAARAIPKPVSPYPPHYALIWDAMLAAAPLPPAAAPAPEFGWISVEDRLPEVEQLVAVYSPPRDTDWPGSVNIGFDCIDQNDDEHASWVCHNAHYEHYCCVAKPEGSTGPREKAPYTHWLALPAMPVQAQGSDAA